ncbi:phage replisome organizer N-terminal domain-containing protein [Anaerococcus hydrogenalis]|uniref:Replisome organizer n=1 Tax=Anaerococcus hydrogenalis TaxID=33029 RepID=A0A2N6UKV2_9FIRM|nr:phage replisome organizer N-terminal domain-containing protein [Anaerococcus hydrogenalis]MDK7694450.1 phage replisome organizer N-terminal domain-containing protein [Anaerococcus hydrogenalis]MDK7696228.1 phage replisome organizer N-terminal domain-containing protein [Anaerococcus hydrogenalis]MDK7707477.1 phage replisome organizer N-terminal domain-containing protein [Anaerococcus hydrogenalis]PMC82492.1 replisome organizer [Anaerococcus hydrogenalis]
MAKNKRYYWLKLKDDFFNNRKMKKLRKVAGGDTYTIIYLKLQLLSINNEGIIEFEGTDEDIYHQLALDIDEEIDDIKMTIAFCNTNDLIEMINDDVFLNEVPALIGSETASTRRSRESRERKKALQSNGQALQCNTNATKCNTEIDIDKDKDINIEIEKRDDNNISKNFNDEEKITVDYYYRLVKNNTSKNDIDLVVNAINQHGWKNILYTLWYLKNEQKANITSFKYVDKVLANQKPLDEGVVEFVVNREIKNIKCNDYQEQDNNQSYSDKARQERFQKMLNEKDYQQG